ncbi:MAG: LysE family transporter [Eubacterium sp.]|nr:LysE family transporter [Eubacterium sp.]
MEKGKQVVFGICAGYFCVQLICSLIIYGLSEWFEPALTVIKYVGFAYLIYLAVHIAISKPVDINESKKPTFLSGFLLQFVNVKIYMYGLTAMNGYIVPYFNKYIIYFAFEMLIAFVGSLASLTWAFMGVKLQKIYKSKYKIINIILAVFLVYCAVMMLFD